MGVLDSVKEYVMSLKMDFKYVVILLVIGFAVWFRTRDEEEEVSAIITNQVLPVNQTGVELMQFFKDYSEQGVAESVKTNPDQALEAFALVEYVKDLCNENGIQNTIDYIRAHREQFLTPSGNYVFFREYLPEVNDFRMLYHHYPDLDLKGREDIKAATYKVCGDLCDLTDIMYKSQEMFKKAKRVVYLHPWFNVKTMDIVEKFNYGYRISDNIIIGSGMTKGEVYSKIGKRGALYSLLATLIMAVVWVASKIDERSRSVQFMGMSVQDIILVAVVSLSLYEILGKQPVEGTIDQELAIKSSVMITAMSVVGFGLASVFMVSADFINVVAGCVFLALLALVDIGNENTASDVKQNSLFKLTATRYSIATLIVVMIVTLVSTYR